VVGELRSCRGVSDSARSASGCSTLLYFTAVWLIWAHNPTAQAAALLVQSVEVTGFEPTASSSEEMKAPRWPARFSGFDLFRHPSRSRKSAVIRGDCHAVRHARRIHDDHKVYGNCRVNGTLSLVPLVASAARGGGSALQTAPPSRTTSTSPASRSRSGAEATTGDSAGDRGIFAEQGHQ
jgi:hypothetical protein